MHEPSRMYAAESPRLRHGDASEDLKAAALEQGLLAVDCETTGLDPVDATLQTVQLHVPGHGTEVVRTEPGTRAMRISELVENAGVLTVFHHAVFDLGFLASTYGVRPKSIACTKIAAKVIWPGRRERHSLKGLSRDLLGVHLDKSQQTSDWANSALSSAQLQYAALDAEILVPLFFELQQRADVEGISDLIKCAWDFIPSRVALEARGAGDVFAY